MSIKQRFGKLVDVKSIVTLTLTGVFAYKTIVGQEISADFKSIYIMIMGFYFGTQALSYASTTKADKG